MKTFVLGRPGAHARRLARKATLRAGVWASVAVVCGLGVLVVAGTQPHTLRVPALVCGTAGLFTGAAMTARFRGEAARASAGASAERRVGKALEACRPVAVVHGATLAAGDADHVVLGPIAVVVETKYGRGQITVQGERLHVGGRQLPRDPLGQARRQATLVAKEIGRPVDAVVCLSEGRGQPQLVSGVWVCGTGDLRSVLDRLGHRVGESEAVSLAQRLSSRDN
jgi:hypothetical protein